MMSTGRKAALSALVLGFAASTLLAQDGATRSPNPSATASLAPAPTKPDTYGTTNISYSRVPYTEFLPADSATTWSDIAQTSLTFSRYPTVDATSGFIASPHLPSGASIVTVELDYCDTNASSNVTLNIYSTSYVGTGGTLIGTVSSTGSSGCDYATTTLATPFTVDNNQNQIVLVAFVPAFDGSLSISGAIIRYKLQVSPAPGSATFPDVPTTDFGFQYVEALNASGITGGCGGGNFCPDSFVTRRQMAIFISKALGLNWQ